MERTRRRISVIVPVLDEGPNVDRCHDAVSRCWAELEGRYALELVFTDNHSADDSFERVRALAARDPRVRGYRFSRNFGYQRSILTGYAKATGDAVIQLDCDLQDPPELIPGLVAQWEQGADVVYGVRRSRREGWWLGLARRVFYRCIDWLSEDHLPHDAGDFRLLSRRVVDALLAIEDHTPYVRGAIASLGFRQVGLPYDRQARTAGASKFPLRALVGLALDGILNHSVVPLRLATWTGLLVSAVTFVAMCGYVVGRLVFGQAWPAGFATTTVLQLLTLSLIALFLGIIGEYLGRIYKQVKRRPLTVIEAEVGTAGAAAD